MPIFFKSEMNRRAARHGPSVCELLGPTPILKMSNTEMLSWAKTYMSYIESNVEVQINAEKWKKDLAAQR